jgi:RNA polymerase sigma factor (sigma-70 family)
MRSDAVLAERVAAGDETAFDVLYERHRPVVLAVCMGVLGTAHDAEDATQETFTALSIALRNNIPAELRPWLIRVARNASIDTTRRRKHRLLTLDGELPEIPARPTTGKAEFAVVMDGIRELPEQQRTALLMRELGGHSYGEIGDFMELDEDAVRGLIARARVGLRTYREATELPCATARACIETEPDGRRYDKTIRRHLRGCTSCRSYRTSLRGDAKALRAALPLQAGAFSGTSGGLATGALSASKAALVGAGMTQLAATCAASVCAVGTVGGLVLIAPVHHLLTDHFAKPTVAVVAKPHRHHHVSHAAPAVHKPAVVPVSGYVAPYQPVVAPTEKRSGSTSAASHDRSRKHPGSSGSSGTHHANKGKGFVHHTPPPSTGVHQSATPSPPTSAPTQPVSTAAAGTGTQTISTSTTASTGGSSGTGNSYGNGGNTGTTSTTSTTSPSGAGGGTSATTNAGPGTTTRPVAQSPITPVTNTVDNVVHSVTAGLAAQSPSGSDQTTTSASTPLGLNRRRAPSTSNWPQHNTPVSNSGWGQHGAPAANSGSGQHGAPTANSGSGQSATTATTATTPTTATTSTTPFWGQHTYPTSTTGPGQHSTPLPTSLPGSHTTTQPTTPSRNQYSGSWRGAY